MKRIPVLSLMICCFAFSALAQVDEVCLSQEEMKLYSLIMEYRAEKGLPKIPLSKSLSYVAQTHAQDSEANYENSSRCNMHSWSNTSDQWKGCCYTNDHKQASCMWDKPKELTDYQSNGYEISHWNSAVATAESALSGWKASSGHNGVIVNLGIWEYNKWEAIGIGIRGGFAHVWFGQSTDEAGKPELCLD